MSAANGKIEFDAGVLSLPSAAFMARAAGTLTVPVGDRFGLQLDLSAATAPGLTSSAALHAFTRDPASYLIGGTLGMIRTPGATVFAAGPEGELYLDRWTAEAWAGFAIARPSSGPDRVAPFIMADLAYYLTDNARLSVGLSSLDGYTAVQLGGEYLLDNFDQPVSLTAETRLGQDGAWRGLVGLRVYLAGEPKSLIRRHREDDPTDRGAALYTAAGGKTIGGGGTGGSAGPTGGTVSSGNDDTPAGEPPHEEDPPTDPNPPVDQDPPPFDPNVPSG